MLGYYANPPSLWDWAQQNDTLVQVQILKNMLALTSAAAVPVKKDTLVLVQPGLPRSSASSLSSAIEAALSQAGGCDVVGAGANTPPIPSLASALCELLCSLLYSRPSAPRTRR